MEYGIAGEYITDAPDGKVKIFIQYLYDSEHAFPNGEYTFEEGLFYSPNNSKNFLRREKSPKGAKAARIYLRICDTGRTVKFDNIKFGTDVSGTISPVLVDPTGTITVTTNKPEATFTISGPEAYNGSGTYWTKVDAPIGTYSIIFHSIADCIMPTDSPKTLTDGGTISFSGSYSCSSPVVNNPPIVNAGLNQNVSAASTVTLDGSGSSDADGDQLTYVWSFTSKPQGSNASLSNSAYVKPTFIADIAGTYILSLVVNDGKANSAADEVVIVAEAELEENVAPVANTGSNQIVNEGVIVTLDGSNSYDPDDDSISYSWSQVAGTSVILSDPSASQPTFTAPEVKITGEVITFQLTVTDTKGLFNSDNATIEIKNIPQLPIADAGADQIVSEGTAVILNGSNSYDPDDDNLSFLWEQIGGSLVTLSDHTSSILTFVTPPIELVGTTLTFQLTVENSGDLQNSDEISVFINDNGILDFPNNVISFYSSTGKKIGVNGGGNITNLKTVNPAALPDSAIEPQNLVYGLIDMQVKVNAPGDAATVTIYLSTPAPDEYKWYKYSPQQGWYDYSDHAEFSNDRTQVTITLVDGGVGDDDGIANGVINDPSGIGTAPEKTDDKDKGCFVTAIQF